MDSRNGETDPLARDFDRLAPAVDVDAAHEVVIAHRQRRRQNRALLSAFALLIAVAGVGAFVLQARPSTERVAADGPVDTGKALQDLPATTQIAEPAPTTSVAGYEPVPGRRLPVEVPFIVLGRVDDFYVSAGTALVHRDLDDLGSGVQLPDPLPVVDFDEQIILSFTIADDLCPPNVSRVEIFETTANHLAVAPVLTQPEGPCRQPLVGWTYLVALDAESLPYRFRFIVPGSDDPGLDSVGLIVTNPLIGRTMGEIRIDKIDLRESIVEGLTTESAKSGIAHFEETASPGLFGNSVLFGHRSVYAAPFSRLDELETGDEIRIEPLRSTPLRYRVKNSYITDATDLTPLADVDFEGEFEGWKPSHLTLVTHHPQHSARQRLVVVAVLDGPPLLGPAPPTAPPVERSVLGPN